MGGEKSWEEPTCPRKSSKKTRPRTSFGSIVYFVPYLSPLLQNAILPSKAYSLPQVNISNNRNRVHPLPLRKRSQRPKKPLAAKPKPGVRLSPRLLKLFVENRAV